ncbi:MAG: 4Fe-4S dicluster domain-containing protein [Candidatus Electrothrix sp. AR3]|nr:4Fe-4S dicluster domain-containing protein [Candidatus Electrothrix sp. AR3]
MNVIIDRKKCNKCMECIEVCPAGVFEKVDGWPVRVHAEKCQQCEYCMNICPEDAIAVAS